VYRKTDGRRGAGNGQGIIDFLVEKEMKTII
jgi:hypothetical protein